MKLPQRYILLMGKDSEVLRGLEVGLQKLECTVTIAPSLEQAIAKVSDSPPDLVLAAGTPQHYTSSSLSQLRDGDRHCPILIFAVSHSPSYQPLTYNDPHFDGYLVNPVSEEVLNSLLQSAQAHQSWCGV